MDCSPPGSSVHGILQARILEWIVRPSSRGLPTWGSNLHLLHCRQILNPLSHLRSPSKVASVALEALLLPLGMGGGQNHGNSQPSHILKGLVWAKHLLRVPHTPKSPVCDLLWLFYFSIWLPSTYHWTMKCFHLENNCYLKYQKNSLVVQWLELHVLNGEGLGLIPVWGTNIPQTSSHRQKKRKF